MEGGGHAGGGVVQAQLCALAVFLGNVGGVVEDGLGQVVDILLRGGGGDDQGCLNGDGGHIRILSGVGPGGDDIGGIEGAGGHHGIGHIAVQGDQVGIVGGAQLGNCRSGSTGDHKRGIDLAVLQRIGGVGEAQVLGLDVILGEPCGGEHVNGVEVNAGAGCANGNGPARQIFRGLDIGVHGHQLHSLGVQSGNHPEGIYLAGVKGAGALPGVGHGIGLNGAQLIVAGVNALDIGLGAIGGHDGHIDAGLILNVLAQHTAVARARVNSFLIFITGFLLFVGSWLSKNFMAVLYYRFCIFARWKLHSFFP